MKFTSQAAALIKTLDKDRQPVVKDYAEQIAFASGHGQVWLDDVKAAILCKDERFLPGREEG